MRTSPNIAPRLAGVLALALWVSACGTGAKPGEGGSAATEITVVAINPYVGRAVFHLSCGPAGGDLPDPARACQALTSEPQLITNPAPFTCAGGFSSWWDVAVGGRLDRQPIRKSFSTCWTPQMRTIGRLGMSWSVLEAHLVPRRQEAVDPGTQRIIPSGALRPGDLVTCDILGHHLELGVPAGITPPGQRYSTGWDGAHVTSVELSIHRREDGSVTASCHRL